jgi:AraC-like DNA-binding protein
MPEQHHYHQLKASTKVLAGEIIDATVLSAKALQDFYAKTIERAKKEDVLLSLHLKATMMKNSDPIMFGFAVKVYFKDLIAKHSALFDYVRENTSIVEVVKKYIEEHYNEEISRNELAGIVYLNADYLARLFKKEEGISITDYVIRMRIKKASELLQYSEISINEIAMKVGYDNFSYFSRLCKKVLGCSPKDYRKKAKEKLNE